MTDAGDWRGAAEDVYVWRCGRDCAPASGLLSQQLGGRNKRWEKDPAGRVSLFGCQTETGGAARATEVIQQRDHDQESLDLDTTATGKKECTAAEDVLGRLTRDRPAGVEQFLRTCQICKLTAVAPASEPRLRYRLRAWAGQVDFSVGDLAG